jgi:hypothetical protein
LNNEIYTEVNAEFMQQGTMVTSDVYCMVIQNERCGMLNSVVAPLHENVSPLAAAHTRALLEHFNWELFDHPSYSPDLAPSHSHPFLWLR